MRSGPAQIFGPAFTGDHLPESNQRARGDAPGLQHRLTDRFVQLKAFHPAAARPDRHAQHRHTGDIAKPILGFTHLRMGW